MIKGKALKGLCLSLIAIQGLSAQAERVKMLDGYMISLNPQASIEGPVYQNNEAGKSEYGNGLARILIQEGHKQGQKYLQYGDTKAYYAVMAAALTIPIHEGLGIHFRLAENNGSLCRAKANVGRTIKNKTARKHFKKAFLKGSTPFLLKCRKLNDEPMLRQMIAGGGDGSDIGVMQLSSLWHYDEFLAKRKFASVRQTVAYGLGHLMTGFKKIAANYAKYPCLQDTRGNLNYQNLVRGAWAGIYNSGNVGQTCRFADPSSPYGGHDRGFLKNLKKTMALNEGGRFGYDEKLELKPDAEARAALEEIVANFKNGTNNREAISKILN